MHTRISDELDESLRRAAEELRVPVSNLVRNLLEDAVDVVETVTDNVGDLVEDVVEEARDFGHRFEDRWRHRVRETRERGRDAGERAKEGGRVAREAAEIARDVAYKARDAALHAVESLRDDREDEARDDAGVETPSRPEAQPLEFPDVAGWQPLVLNAEQECAGCGRHLFRGDSGYLAVGDPKHTTTYLCENCLESLD